MLGDFSLHPYSLEIMPNIIFTSTVSVFLNEVNNYYVIPHSP
jgi:hypothetical protein